MGKKSCAICQKDLGALSSKIKLKDGSYLCKNCLKEHGYSSFDGKSLAYLKTVTLNDFLKNDRKSLVEAFTPDIKITNIIQIDSSNRLFKTNGSLSFKRLYKIDDINSYEIVENGNSVTTANLGRSAIGAIAFGPAGAIIGALTGGKKKNYVEKLQLKLNMNNMDDPVVYIDVISTKTKTSSIVYKQYIKDIDKAISIIQNLLTKSAEEDNTQNGENDNISLLKDYKDLLTAEIITQEEFDAKKKELLNL